MISFLVGKKGYVWIIIELMHWFLYIPHKLKNSTKTTLWETEKWWCLQLILPLRRKLLCCPSERVSECITIESEPPTNCANFDPMLPNLWNFPGAGVFSEYFTEMLLSYIFRPRVVKYDILRNNRCSKLHAVLDCLFFSLKRHSLLRGEHNGINSPPI